MLFEEYVAKPLLAGAGISVPTSRSVRTADEAATVSYTHLTLPTSDLV